MSEEQNNEQQKIEQVLPICPFCGHDPFRPAMIEAAYEDAHVRFGIYFCADCRKVVNLQIARPQPQISVPGGPRGPLIHLPGHNPTRKN